MTLNNPSGAEIMTAETGELKPKVHNLDESAFYNIHSNSLNVVEIIDILRSFLAKEII